MASLQERNGSYRILFCYHGKLHAFTIGKSKERSREESPAGRLPAHAAEAATHALPEGIDIVTFVEFDGEPPKTPAGAAQYPARRSRSRS